MTRKLKFVVMLGGNKFSFDDGTTAISFAALATEYFVPDDYAKELKALIKVVKVKCED